MTGAHCDVGYYDLHGVKSLPTALTELPRPAKVNSVQGQRLHCSMLLSFAYYSNSSLTLLDSSRRRKRRRRKRELDECVQYLVMKEALGS